MNLRLVFMGTPDFAVPSLEALLAEGFDVAAVFTQPDRRRGRGQRVRPGPVKRAALAAGLAVHQPESLRDEEALALLKQLAPDAIVVVAFGQLLPKEVLDLPPLGCVNVHASLLPRHRGAAPIQAALVAGDRVTGVTTMFMDEGLDTGDVILRREIAVGADDDAGTLHDRLAREGAGLLVETLRRLAAGEAPRTPQDDEEATYAPRLTRDDARIRWDGSADAVVRHIRAFAPRPGAFSEHRGRSVKILRARPVAQGEEGAASGAVAPEGSPFHPAGAVVAIGPDGFVVQTGVGRIVVTEIQPAGRGPMSGRDYSNGYRLQVGERFGPGSKPAVGGDGSGG